jgi:hypothetical protein
MNLFKPFKPFNRCAPFKPSETSGSDGARAIEQSAKRG